VEIGLTHRGEREREREKERERERGENSVFSFFLVCRHYRLKKLVFASLLSVYMYKNGSPQ